MNAGQEFRTFASTLQAFLPRNYQDDLLKLAKEVATWPSDDIKTVLKLLQIGFDAGSEYRAREKSGRPRADDREFINDLARNFGRLAREYGSKEEAIRHFQLKYGWSKRTIQRRLSEMRIRKKFLRSVPK